MKKMFTLSLLLWIWHAQAQQTISGKVVNKLNGEPVPNATVMISGEKTGTKTDENGFFKIAVTSSAAKIIVSSVGYETEVTAGANSQQLVVKLSPVERIQEVVVLAPTRTPLRLLESPTSIERLSIKDFQSNPAAGYYDMIGQLKGVDVITSSMNFKTYSTRGFNISGSDRVNQIVDGMDNQTPGLNFPIGNFAGLTELDVESIEVLPGASSALYGPGGINGTILINSKNPFRHQGLSLIVKQGVTNIDKTQRTNATAFNDFSFRYAKAINRFAFKLSGQYMRATDWLADDRSNYSRLSEQRKVISGTRETDPNYDGVNVYGDETSVDIYPFLSAMLPPGHPLLEHMQVSRTGYAEKDIVDPITKNLKFSAAVHQKFGNNIEAQLMGYLGTGNTVYTGDNRYVFKSPKIGQYKLEVKGAHWFLRSYTTQEDAGESYSATLAMQVMNELWKPSYLETNPAESWYPQFTGAYLQAMMAGAPKSAAIQMAREYADQGRPLPGTAAFQSLFDIARKQPIPNGGLFKERSQLWMQEGQYDFKDQISFANIVIGGNWKRYVLNSTGTLFIDTAGAITINELGGYIQATKNLMNDRLSLSFSGRWDKNEDFKARFTPRATMLIKIRDDNNLRLSYQTAYRFPSTLQKYIRLNAGSYTLLGGLPWVPEYIKEPVAEITPGGAKAYEFKPLKPEALQSFEVGYKALIGNKLLVDAYAYAGKYYDFLGRNILMGLNTGRIYSTVVNSQNEVKTRGLGIGLDYKTSSGISFFANGYHDVITDISEGFQSAFNTPKYRANAGVTGTGLGKSKAIGFSLRAHWQDAFYYENELANGPVDAFTTVDAQVNYTLKKQNTVIKIGGSNVLNHYYKTGYGNPQIGGQYYISIGFRL